VVATRLQQQLASLPARLRYDELTVAAADVAGALDASFERVGFGARRQQRMRVRWWPQAAGGPEVQLLAPEARGEMPLLAQWPVDEHGAWSPSWSLPLGDAPPALRERAWRTMGPADRELLLGLLDALPAVAERARALRLPDGPNGAGLEATASRPLRMAQRALHGSRLRRVVRALRGRVGP
jgi:hypothetical protein